MLTKKLIFLYTVVLGSFFLGEAQGFRQPKCRGKETKLTSEELKTMGDCLKVSGGGSKNFEEVPKDKMGCVGKCILTKYGLIDSMGKPMKENVFKMVNASMDTDVAKMADERVGKCIDEKSSGINTTEKECKTYWPLVECIAGAFMQVCMMNGTSTSN